MKIATVDVQTSYNRNRSRHKRDNVSFRVKEVDTFCIKDRGCSGGIEQEEAVTLPVGLLSRSVLY